MHCRLKNLTYYPLEAILHNDLVFGIAEENNLVNVILFPNPASDMIGIKNPETPRFTEIAILDMYDHRRLYQTTDFSDIDVHLLPSGIYFVRS